MQEVPFFRNTEVLQMLQIIVVMGGLARILNLEKSWTTEGKDFFK